MFALVKADEARDQREESVVSAHSDLCKLSALHTPRKPDCTYMLSRVKYCAPLSYNNVAGHDVLVYVCY